MAGWRCLTSPTPRSPAMTVAQAKLSVAAAKELLKGDPDGRREVVRAVLQEVPEAEMTDALGAAKGERTAARLGYRSSYYGRTLVTRVGKPEPRVPQDREGRFSTELFERYQRSEQALVASLAEMYVQGVSTRKVKAVTEELCGHAFSASAISAVNKRLDEGLAAFARRRLEEPFAYLVLDARYERVREAGIVGGAGRGRDRPGGTAPGARGRAGEPREPLVVEGLPARAEGAGPARRGVRGRGRPRRAQGGAARGAARRLRPALRRPLPQERPRPPAARGRRRPPAGAAPDRSPPSGRRSRTGGT